MDIYSATLLLFLVIDPFGNIPAFLAILRRAPLERQRSIIIREMVIALVVLVFFLFSGRYILNFLRISSAALSVAGGVILFLIALRMVFPGGDLLQEGAAEEEPFIVPLAIPLIAGPSAMTMVMLLMAASPGRWAQWLGAVVLA